MSSEYLSDREQEEALRNWWNENWRWVISGVAVGLALLGAWNFWQRHVAQQSEAAAQALRDATVALASGDKTKIDAAVKNLDDNYSGSPYVDQVHLLVAQAYVSSGQFELAASELKRVMEKSKDEALAGVAKLRLARVQIQLGHYDEALLLLDVTKAGAFAAEMNEVRGDALLAKGDAAGARQAYEAALAARMTSGASNADDSYLRLKLQDLAAAAPQTPVQAHDEMPAKTNPPPTEK
jgi:predicted negative regulator of RcsB-dependent stress response